jgi:hypothetical protein
MKGRRGRRVRKCVKGWGRVGKGAGGAGIFGPVSAPPWDSEGNRVPAAPVLRGRARGVLRRGRGRAKCLLAPPPLKRGARRARPARGARGERGNGFWDFHVGVPGSSGRFSSQPLARQNFAHEILEPIRIRKILAPSRDHPPRFSGPAPPAPPSPPEETGPLPRLSRSGPTNPLLLEA